MWAFIGFVLAVISLSSCVRPIELWKSMGVQIISWRDLGLMVLTMTVSTALPFIIWIQFNVSPTFVHVSVAVLILLTGLGMLGYLTAKLRAPAAQET